jgi:multidrug resistance protein, MATE family
LALGSFARGILALAWPILCGQLAVMAYGVIDTVMTGHSSPADLAAMGLGASVYISVFGTLMGVVSALNPIIAQHFGARRDAAVGSSFVQGLWLGLLLSAVGAPVLAFPELWLVYIDLAPDVSALVTQYLRILSLGLPASLMFRAMYALNTSVSRPKVIMAMQVLGLGLKIVLNYLLIFGQLGLPRLGAPGCALASLIVGWALFVMGWAYIHREASYRRFAIQFAWPQWEALKEQLHLGLPMGLSYALEYTSFTFMALLIPRLGTNVMGGQQITMNLAASCYQLPLALAVSTATLTAQALGADDHPRAREVAFTGIRIGVIVAVVTSFLVWALRSTIIGLYTNEDAVAMVAFPLIGYLIGFHVFDALQVITSFVLRAYRIAVVPTLIYGVALWGVGLVGGYFVAFYPVLGGPRGAPGMWLMQGVALFLTALLLVSFYLRVLKRQPRATGPALPARQGPSV